MPLYILRVILYNFNDMIRKFKFVLALLLAALCFEKLFAARVSVQRLSGSVLECSAENAPLTIKREGGFDIVKSPGCAETFTQGEAALPVRNFFVALGGASGIADIEVVSVEKTPLAGALAITGDDDSRVSPLLCRKDSKRQRCNRNFAKIHHNGFCDDSFVQDHLHSSGVEMKMGRSITITGCE